MASSWMVEVAVPTIITTRICGWTCVGEGRRIKIKEYRDLHQTDFCPNVRVRCREHGNDMGPQVKLSVG
jgi:hypothetical protein